MKQRRLKLAAGLSAAFLALSTPLPALAEDSVVISIEGWGDWVLVTTEVCATAFGHTVCHRFQKWEWRPEQQQEIQRCDGLCP